MTFCPKCGRQTGEEVNFCPNCGNSLRPIARSEDHLEVVRGVSKKIGMILTLMGGSLYLFFGILITYIYIATLASLAGNPIPPAYATLLYNGLIVFITVLIAGILVTIGGLYLNSDISAHRVQGGIIALVSAIVGLIPPLLLPFLFPSPLTVVFFGPSIIPFIVQFSGFVFALVGVSLGITYKPPRN